MTRRSWPSSDLHCGCRNSFGMAADPASGAVWLPENRDPMLPGTKYVNSAFSWSWEGALGGMGFAEGTAKISPWMTRRSRSAWWIILPSMRSPRAQTCSSAVTLASSPISRLDPTAICSSSPWRTERSTKSPKIDAIETQEYVQIQEDRFGRIPYWIQRSSRPGWTRFLRVR